MRSHSTLTVNKLRSHIAITGIFLDHWSLRAVYGITMMSIREDYNSLTYSNPFA